MQAVAVVGQRQPAARALCRPVALVALALPRALLERTRQVPTALARTHSAAVAAVAVVIRQALAALVVQAAAAQGKVTRPQRLLVRQTLAGAAEAPT
jgi:hypothetical protein